MGIESVNNQQVQQTSVSMTADVAATDAAVQTAAAEVAPLFSSDSNLNVQESKRADDKTTKDVETTDAPVLDDAVIELLQACNVDLEALIAKLQAETEESQVASSKERIESLQGQMEAQQQISMDKISEQIDAMKEAENAAVLQNALGWLGVVIAAAALILTCVTGGGAAAIAFAAVGLAVSLTTQTLNQTGVMEDLVNMLADSLMESNSELSSQEAKAAAELIIAAVELAVSLVCIVGSAASALTKTAGKISEKAMKAVKVTSTVLQAVMSGVGIGANAYAGKANYDAGMASADVKDAEAVLQKLQKLLDDESEDLQLLIQQLMDSMSAVTDLLASKQDALKQITMNIGA